MLFRSGALIRDYIKWDDQPASAEAAVEAVLRADQITRTTPCGPVYICLDAEMQEAALDREVKIPPVARYRSAEAPAASADLVARVAKALRGAKFPVILAGRVSRRKADWERRVRLAEALGAAVLTTLHKGAAFPTEHPNHVLAPMGDKPSPDETKLLEKADVILSLDWHDLAGAISARSGKSQTQSPTAATVVHCSLDSYLANGWSMDHQALPAVDLPVLADPDRFVAQLLEALPAGEPAAAPQQDFPHWTKSVPAGPSADKVFNLDQLALTLAEFAKDKKVDRKSTRLNSSHVSESRMPSSA